MSKYRWRSMSAELREGATDGTVKKLRPLTNDQATPGNTAAVLKDKQAMVPSEYSEFGPFNGITGGKDYLPGVF